MSCSVGAGKRRRPRPPPIEQHHPGTSRETAPEMLQGRLLPAQLELADQPRARRLRSPRSEGRPAVRFREDNPEELARDEPDQVPRLLAFRAAHPHVIIGAGEFGVWQALIPRGRTARPLSTAMS